MLKTKSKPAPSSREMKKRGAAKNKKKIEPAAPPTYQLKPEERAAIDKSLEERKIAPAPRLKVKDNQVSIDHPDELIGHLLMQNALGTLDSAFMLGLVDQLAKATSGGSRIDEDELNFMVSFIKGIEPRDQVESLLAAQMVTIHMAMMAFLRHLPLIELLPQQDAAEQAINKFARTFTTQMDALKRYRSGGEQKVTVTHVSVSEGGQAIVGNVTQNPRDAASDNVPSPPLAITHSKVSPMEIIAEPVRKPAPVKRKPNK